MVESLTVYFVDVCCLDVKDTGSSDCSNSDKQALFKATRRVDHALQFLSSCTVVVKLARDADLTWTSLKWWYSSGRVALGGGGRSVTRQK